MIQSQKQLFINDFYRKGMLHAEIYRSPIEKGEIISCILPDSSDVTVVDLGKIPGAKEIDFFNAKIPVLTDKKISYKGEEIFILASDSYEKIEEYKKKIEIEYKLNSSLKFSSSDNDLDIIDVKYFSYPDDNKTISPEASSHLKRNEKKSAGDDISVQSPVSEISKDSIEEIIGEDVSVNKNRSIDNDKIRVFEDDFYSGEYHSRYCEPNGAVVIPEKNGSLTVYTVSQWPDHVKKSVASVTGISPSKVNVVISDLSSPLEGRIWYPSLAASRAAAAAVITNKPVKLFLTEKENHNYTPRQFPFSVNFRTILKDNEKSLAAKIDIDSGCLNIIDSDHFRKTLFSAALFYGFDRIETEIRIIRTSKPPMSFISSFNFTQILSAFEIHINNTAVKMGENPYNWRLKNIFPKEGRKHYNLPDIKSFTNSRNSINTVIRKVAEMSDFSRKHASYELQRKTGSSTALSKKRGIGISVCFFNNDLPVESLKNSKLSLKLLLDSSSVLNIYTSTVPDGKYNYSIWKNIASEILRISREDIKIAIHETSVTPESSPYIFSKEVAGFSELLRKSCQSLQRKRFRAPLPIEIKRTVSLDKLKKGDIAWGASIVEVEFDSMTLETEIKGIWNCIDCGQIISEPIIDKKIYSGIIDSLNWLSSTTGGTALQSYSDNSWKFYDVPITTEYINSNSISRALSPGDMPLALIPGAYYYALKQAIGKDTSHIPFKESGFYNIIRQDDIKF